MLGMNSDGLEIPRRDPVPRLLLYINILKCLFFQQVIEIENNNSRFLPRNG